jgi:membrane protease YdiL (CAAX protease family)
MTESGPLSPATPPRIGREFDPLLAVVWLLLLLLGFLAVRQRITHPQTPAASAGLQGRILELQAAASEIQPMGPAMLQRATKQITAPWDRAVGGVLAAEAKDMALARSLALEGAEPAGPGADFRAAFRGAYEDGPLPPPERVRAVATALGGGHAARLLEARLAERRGDTEGARVLRKQVRDRAGLRLLVLASVGLTVMGLVAGGLGFGIFLLLTRKVPPRLPLAVPATNGRGMALVFGVWGLALLLSGSVAALLIHLAPALKPYALLPAYGLHAILGLLLLARVEGLPVTAVLRRLGSPAPLRALAWAAGFLALGTLLVLAVGLLLSPLLRNTQPPQRELMEMIRGTGGFLPTAVLFLTMAGLAPAFEELMFRGALLPWLQARLGARWAVPLSALAFAAIHLQPMALPTLFTLGTVLGLAARRTGGLLAPVAVHAAWNGGVFILMRLLI